MLLPGRTFQAGSGSYRFGFGGQEKSKEINDNSYTAEYWQYDARIVRRWNPDPIFKEYESPYAAFGNNPIWNVDPNGADTAKYLTNSQLAAAVKIVYNVINEDVKAKKYNAKNDRSAELNKAMEDYWKNHQGEYNFQAAAEFQNTMNQYYKGFTEVATRSSTAWDRLGQRISNDNISDATNVHQAAATIHAYNGSTQNLVTDGANVAMATAAGAVGVGPGRGPKLNSRRQQVIINSGGQKPVLVPQKATDVANYVKTNNGAAMQGYKGGRAFLNDGRGGGQILPKTDANARSITYREYDVNPFTQGVNRGAERVVIGSNGKSYYTSDHYRTFTQINQ